MKERRMSQYLPGMKGKKREKGGGKEIAMKM
jgi:hypothetical protein